MSKSANPDVRKRNVAEWSTPPELFQALDDEFHFTLDACAQPWNAKCKKFFTPQDDGLAQSWAGETVFCCPPSGVTEYREWTQKALEESRHKGTTVVMLLPVSTDTQWFHKSILGQNGVTIRFLSERVRFVNSVLPSWRQPATKYGGPRSTMVVVMTGKRTKFKVEI